MPHSDILDRKMAEKESTCVDAVVDVFVYVGRVGEVLDGGGGADADIFLHVSNVSFDRHRHRCTVCF